MSGLFITFEGMEGSGKSTQIQLLRSRLQVLDLPTVFSKEPGGTSLGGELRYLLLRSHESGERWCAKAELLLFYADRAQHLDQVIQPAMEKGQIVVVDRFEDSSRAYQGACGVSEESLDILQKLVLGHFRPQLTILLDLDPEKALQRVKDRNGENFKETRFDGESCAFHSRVRERFQLIAKEEPERIKLIDAGKSIDAVAQAIWEEVSLMLAKCGFAIEC